MKTKLSASLGAVGLAVLAAWGISAPAAHADEVSSAQFVPYDVTVNWYKAGGVAATNDIWPQDLHVITCGGIEQKGDTYHITTLELEDYYKSLIAGGKLNSPADDSRLTPTGYEVIQLPDCVVKPPQPADRVTSVTTHNLVCADDFYYTTVTTTTISSTYDEETNTWVDAKPIVTSDTTKVKATVTQCPPIVPTPPVVTPPVVTPPVHPTPTPPKVSTPSKPAPPAVVPVVKSERLVHSTTPTTPPTATGLAYTGSDTLQTMSFLAFGSAAIIAGIFLAIILPILRRRRNI